MRKFRLGWVGVLAAVACAGGQDGRGSGSDTEAETLGGSAAGSDGRGGVSSDPGADEGPGGTTIGTPNDTGVDGTDGQVVCGDGVVGGDEECDEGEANADDAACTSECRLAVCGDGLLLSGREACDDGNADESDACTTLCAPPSCTDGIRSGDETDVDCGGGCEACVAGRMCGGDADCRNQSCTGGICAPAASCAELLASHPGLADGVYTIDPNGSSVADAVSVFCDMSTGGGGWTALAANGDVSVPETSDPADCYPLITAQPGEGCGDPSDLMNDFTLVGDQQGALPWRYLMAIAYGEGGYDDKLAFFAIDFGASQATQEERFNGVSYVPTGITTDYGEIACTGYSIVHYTRSGTYNPSGIANGKGTVFGHDSTLTMNDTARRTFGFTDASDAGATGSGSGVDDYQDGWSCSDMWGPQQIRGARMVVLVR